MSVATASADATGPQARAHGQARLPRIALATAACLAGAALSAIVLRNGTALRVFEARLAGHVVPLATGINAGAIPGAPIVWFENTPGRYLGMYISPECTVDALIVPFIIGAAWSVWHQARLVRPLVTLAIATGLLLAVNQLRILVIVALTKRFGYGKGFYWGHTLIGSLITIFGVALVFFCYVLIGLRRKRSRRTRENQVSTPAAPPAG